MNKGFAVCLTLAAFALGVLTLSQSNAQDKGPSIKEIMTKAHKGGNAILNQVGKELKSGSPDWANVEKQSKELVDLGTSLSKADPPKGDKSSWETLTGEYLKHAKELKTAAASKDQKEAQKHHGELSMSCAACHKAHKGK